MKRKPRFSDFGQISRKILRSKSLSSIIVTMEQDPFLGFFFIDRLRMHLAGSYEWQEIDWARHESAPDLLFGQGDLFSNQKVVVINGLDHGTKFGKAIKVIHQLQQMGNDRVVIRKTSIPTGQGFWKDVEKMGIECVPCVPPYDNEVPAAIQLFSDLLKVPLGGDAIQMIQASLGTDLRLIHNEIARFSLIFPDQKTPLTSAQVADHLDVLKQDHVFKINDLLLERKNAKAAILANDLIKRGESPIAMVGILARHIRNTLQIKDLKRSGIPPRQMASELRLPLMVVNRYTEYANRTTKAQLGRALAQCHEADICLKSSRRDPYLVLDQIVSALHS